MQTHPSLLILALRAAFCLAPVSGWADFVYVSNTNSNTIERFTESGIGSVFATTSSSPRGLAFDSAGNLYVAYPSLNIIEKFSSTGVDLGPFVSTSLSTPEGLAFDSGGNLYASNLANHTIRRFTATGFDLGTFASTGLTSPFGIAFDSTGNLFAANSDTGNIQKFTQFGVGSFFGSPGQFGVAVDTFGNVYSATGSLTITKVTPAGVSSSFATTSTDPFGLAFDSAGILYATFPGTNSIERFASNGTSLGTFANTGLDSPNFITTHVPEPSSALLLLSSGILLFRCRTLRTHERNAS